MAGLSDDYDGMTAREMADEMENCISFMQMPVGYQCLGFAIHNGTKWDKQRWFVALKVDGLPKPYEEDAMTSEAPAT